LPILGINYLNFNALGGKGQFAMLFGGVLAFGNLQVPKFGSLPLDFSLDFSGIGVPSRDIVIDDAGERPGERVQSFTESAGANLGYQITPFQKVSAHYTLKYDYYFRDTETAETFTLPASAITNGAGVSYEFKRGGYAIGGNWMAYRRSSSAD